MPPKIRWPRVNHSAPASWATKAWGSANWSYLFHRRFGMCQWLTSGFVQRENALLVAGFQQGMELTKEFHMDDRNQLGL